MSVKKFGIRVLRKTTVVGNRVLKKASHFADKVERKSTRILDGVDFTLKVDSQIPFEKLYYGSIPEVLPIHASMPAVGSKPNVTLLIPSLDGASFFGGTATALVVAAKIALQEKRKLRIVQTLKTGHPDKLGLFFHQEGIDIDDENIQVFSIAERSYNRYGYISMHPEDIFIASAWWDAHNLSNMPLKRKFIYLVQDFEPIFYNNSDSYLLAESTYKSDGFIPICNTQLMAEFMRDRKYKAFTSKTLFFEPAVSRESTGRKEAKQPGEKKKLFLYGRSNVHRNLFFSGLGAIDYSFKTGALDPGHWEVVMAGQDNLTDIRLSSGVTVKNLGKMSVTDYISFSKSVDLAVSLMMAPHPNYPTLEFSSIGVPVVTTRYANKKDLSRYSDGIVMADSTVESISGAINVAAQKPYKHKTTLPADWHDSLDHVLPKLLSAL